MMQRKIRLIVPGLIILIVMIMLTQNSAMSGPGEHGGVNLFAQNTCPPSPSNTPGNSSSPTPTPTPPPPTATPTRTPVGQHPPTFTTTPINPSTFTSTPTPTPVCSDTPFITPTYPPWPSYDDYCYCEDIVAHGQDIALPGDWIQITLQPLNPDCAIPPRFEFSAIESYINNHIVDGDSFQEWCVGGRFQVCERSEFLYDADHISASMISTGGTYPCYDCGTYWCSIPKRISLLKVDVTIEGTPVPDGAIHMISNSPEMPQIMCELFPKHAPGNVFWYAEVEYSRKCHYSFKRYPYDAQGFQIIDILEPWNLTEDFYTDIRGGILRITAVYQGRYVERYIHIRAENPTEAMVMSEIGNTPWFACALAKWESHPGQQGGRPYCQFNEVGMLGPDQEQHIKNCPNFGARNNNSDEGGWGIMQLDTVPHTAQELWDWTANIECGMHYLRVTCRSEAQSYFNAVQRTYPVDWEPPPQLQLQLPDGMIEITALDAANIQLYNTATVLENLMGSDGQYRIYRSCWKFFPHASSGDKWLFVPNRNSYVLMVVNTYEQDN